MQHKNKSARIAYYGLLIALSMVLGFVETLIPLPVPLPFIKIGLANLVTMLGLYTIGTGGTVVITILRVVLTGLSFGNPYSMMYSFAGAFLSLAIMSCARRYNWFGVTGTSVLGGIGHNIGQLVFAAIIVKTPGVFYYLPLLLAAGCLSGSVIGLLGSLMIRRVGKFMKNLS